jgi:predicted MPP superfamily phosphohydrolase
MSSCVPVFALTHFSDPVWCVILFVVAVVGHSALMVTAHNWWYGHALPRKAGDVIHALHGLMVLFGPVFFWWLGGLDLAAVFDWNSETAWWQFVFAAYVAVCWLVAVVVFPGITALRLLRPRPRALVETKSAIFDVAKHVGYQPLGDSKQRFLGRLPYNEIFQVDMVERTICLPRVPPAWDGLTILQLTDLHFCGTPDKAFFRAVLDRCNDPEPDIVALTGDVADTVPHARWIVPLLGRLRYKVAAFAILGNHDFWHDAVYIRRRLGRLKMNVLANTWKQIDVRGQPLVAIGNEYPWNKQAVDLSACPTEPFRLCLSHTPDNIAWARRANVDLMLSGHVHGGQIRFPIFGSMLVPSKYGRRYDCGAFDEKPTFLYVGRGLSGEHPIRYLCKPEVTRIVLRSPTTSSPTESRG